jgi:uncharacterized protein with FMN-binding domain
MVRRKQEESNMKKISRQGFLKIAAAAAMSGVTAGALAACNSASESAAASSAASAVGGEAVFTPGTYTATANGIGTVSVTMTFSETAITDVQLDVSGETDSIGGAAADTLQEALLAAQSAEIDGVAGATVTSNAVKEAAASCIQQAVGVDSASSATVAETTTWRTAPEEIADSEISETYEVEVGIIGLGYAGLSTCRQLAEAGTNVLVVESMAKDSWWTVGHDIGHINSEFQKSHGVPEVDVVEFFNNWMVQAQNKPNPSLVMQFAKNCGSAVDWFFEPVSDEILEKAHVCFFPENEYTVRQLNNGYRYYPGTVQWWEDSWNGLGTVNNGDGLEMKNISWANYDYIEANCPNAQVLFGTSGVQLIKEGDRVAGFIAKDNTTGNYIKVLASKGVVLAGGGFGGNAEMCKDLLGYVDRTFAPDEGFICPFGRDGSTIKMGVWAGGRLETDISSMNFDSMTIPDYMPGPLWVNSYGERFQNEASAGPELNGFFMARTYRGDVTSIFDSTYPTQILRGYPGHQAFDYSDEKTVNDMLANFEAAKAAGAAGTEDGFYCADTLEELADALGYDADQKATFLATIEQYNSLCDAGVDTDFGKDPRFLNAVKEGPFYAHKTTPSLGFALVTTGGFVTTKHQQVLDENFTPIDGLYACGNTCGMRFGAAYITPMAGVSIGICVTLGRELGKYLAAL